MSDRAPRWEGRMVPGVGLCSICAHARILGNRRGSRFYLCELAAADPAYPRYPPLPVLECVGFSPAPPPAPGETE